MEKQIELCKKICMLGSFGAGKTSLVRRFVFNKYEEKYLSTIGVLISQKQLPVLKLKGSHRIERLKFIIWDLAFVEKFNEMINNYFKGAAGAIVVFDVTRSHISHEINTILKKFKEINPNSQIIFAFNKIDLIQKKSPEMKHFLKIADSYGVDYQFTSAKTGENVEKLFTILGRDILKAE